MENKNYDYRSVLNSIWLKRTFVLFDLYQAYNLYLNMLINTHLIYLVLFSIRVRKHWKFLNTRNNKHSLFH